LFDPGVQRIFSRTLRRLAAGGASTTVVRSGTVRTARYGPAQCFTVRGQRVDAGRYCLLEGGRFAGVPARVQFRSGALKVLSIDRGLSDSVFRPVVRPTPLPG
jgi:predicted nicotinamide N-methyase